MFLVGDTYTTLLSGEIGKPGQRGVLPPAFDPADVASMAGVAAKYRFSFLTD